MRQVKSPANKFFPAITSFTDSIMMTYMLLKKNFLSEFLFTQIAAVIQILDFIFLFRLIRLGIFMIGRFMLSFYMLIQFIL